MNNQLRTLTAQCLLIFKGNIKKATFNVTEEALRKTQRTFKDEAEQIGIKNDEDVQSLVEEV